MSRPKQSGLLNLLNGPAACSLWAIVWPLLALGFGNLVLAQSPGRGPEAQTLSCWTIEGEKGKSVRGTVRVPDSFGDEPGLGRGLGGCAPFEMLKASPMYRRVNGIVALLEPRDVRSLAGMTLRRAPGLRPDEHAEVLYEVSLCDTTELRRIQIVLCPDGGVWAQLMDLPREEGKPGHPPPGEPEALDRVKFFELAEKWSWFGRGFDGMQPSVPESDPAATAEPFELPHPYLPARWILDRDTLGDRFLRGRTPQIPPADRVLEIEKLFVRIPRSYSPREPAGLLVWMSADDEGRPPAVLSEALDTFNMIAVGFAKCGNTRPVANRYQLAIDAVATATRRFHIDPRRVYVSGISGGGRVSSVLAACFPDVFTGAIPIVGLNCPEPVPVGGGRYVAPAFARPAGKRWDLFRQRRIAAITGGKDFNQPEVIAAAQVLRTDGVQVKVFEYLDMGHELPTPARFAEALKWVDEPWQKLRKNETELGERELRAATAKAGIGTTDVKVGSGQTKPLSQAARLAFMRVTESAPWTPAAWKATDRLTARAAPETPASPDP